jgi:hypothetical protein
MPEMDPIELIKEQLGKADGLGGLHPDHERFKQWHTDTGSILEKAFGPRSIHYQSFLALRFREIAGKTFASPEIDKINATRYKRDLENSRNILQGAIKELTLDRTLFKKIQTTPKTVEISLQGEYFISSGIKDPDVVQTLKTFFEGSGLNPVYSAQRLHDRIEQIQGARLGIYDLSSSDKTDTLLELGIALGLRKESILIHKKGILLPETIQELNRIEYETLSDLIESLRKKIHV